MSADIDAFIERFHREGFIAAGRPGPALTIAMVNEITRLRGLADEVQGLNATLSIALDEITKQRDSLRAEVEALRAPPCDGCGQRVWEPCSRPPDRTCFRAFHGGSRAPTTDAPGLGLGERGV